MTLADSRYTHSSPLYSASTWTADQTFNDDVLLSLGTGADAGITLNSLVLAADGEVGGVIIGTSDHPGAAIHSLLIGNTYDDGDIMLSVTNGSSNTTMSMLMDASAADLILHGITTLNFDVASTISTTAGNLTITAGGSTGDVLIGDGDGTILYVDGGTGTVGINQAAVAAETLAIRADPDSTSGTHAALRVENFNTPSGSSATTLYGIDLVVEQDAQNNTETLRGINAAVNWGGSGTGAVAHGVRSIIQETGSGTITEAAAFYANTASGTITNNYGVYIKDQTTGTNDYGLYIEGADTYALWVDADSSRFDGPVLINNDVTLDGDLDFTGPQEISTTSGDLTLAPASDLYINPTAAGGTFSFGTGVSNNYMFQIGGAWTSGNASTICSGITYNAQLTTDATNHSVSATHMHMGADLGAKINLLRDCATVATMFLTEPNIDLDPLTSGSDFSVTQAATLYINNAPTEAGSSKNYALFVDAGASRFDGAISLGTDHGDDGQQLTSGGDDAACDWTAPTSIREDKDIIGLADPDEALQAMLSSKAYNFHYKNKRGTGDTLTNYVGIMADEAPWAMHYKGRVVNPVNTLGYTVLAFQAMERQVEELQTRLAAIGG